ncbi:hypothetical protein [Aquimarina spongiae]|uniref:Uncharacterized protein n=1 Tax=Aquimarina spongiae TaxID=570521 RepID=A0A1M6BDJ6_9FLAO|nr:hypothetical protein [Aquimarina spongiae]SHI46757.1 hypothetical protein SAMN04488508_101761 [Aquimarina spongiae]
MIKNILNLNGVTVLKKGTQKSINGGFFGCEPSLFECRSDSDCPCGPCGITINNGGNPIFVSGVCAF